MRLRRPGLAAGRSRRPLAGLVVAILAAAGALVALPLPASAAARAFEPVYEADLNGDVIIRGNTLHTCFDAALFGGFSCAQGQAGEGRNDQFNMVDVDVDDDPGTFSSSSATVTVPPGATVKFAGLSWGARTNAGSGGSAPYDSSRTGTVKFKVPGSAVYATVQDLVVDSIGFHYQGFADVTAAVAQAGSGAYTVADVQAATGGNTYAGWSLTVVYEDLTQPMRHLAVLSGYASTGGSAGRVTVPVSGFTTPYQGAVNTRLGVVAYEGDRGSGDEFSLNSVHLRNETNPLSDFFNSTITDLDVAVTDRDPAYPHQLGFDIDRFDASGMLANGATQATISLYQSSDVFYPGVLTFVTDQYVAPLTATKSVVDVNGGDVRPGDRLDYSIEAEATTTDAALQSALSDVFPEQTSYVPGSLRIDGNPVTDSYGGDDTGSASSAGVIAYLGAGATWYDGGRLALGESATVSFSVQVSANAFDGVQITNIAELSYRSETTLEYLSGVSNTVTSTVRTGPVITTTDFPAGQVSVAYSQGLAAEGGTGAYTWSVSQGALPAGITLDAGTGLLSGTPTARGTFKFSIKVTDALNRTDTQDLTITVLPGVSLSADRTSVRFDEKVTLTTTVAPSEATGTVTFSVAAADSSSGGGSVDLGTLTVVAGQASATVAMPRLGLNKVTATYSGDTLTPAATSAPVGVEATAYQGQVLVTEFRTSGPLGAEDSYVELTNMGPDVPLDGFTVQTGAGTVGVIPPGAGILGSGRSYLLGGQNYSLIYAAHPDRFLTTFGDEGIRVVAPDTATTVTDAVGPSGAGFHRGTPLPSLGGEPDLHYAWWRTQANGLPVDTGNNDADFALVSVDESDINGVRTTIGSPSPTGTTSPHRHNASLFSTLLDPRVGQSMGANRQYVAGTPGTPSTAPTAGTLTVRRTITNTSSVPVTEAKVRITALSAHDGEPRPGTLVQPTSHAALRLVQPTTPTDLLPMGDRGVVTVLNLGPDAPNGGLGGGLNSTLNVPLPNGGLAPNQSVHVAFTFAVDKPGTYWFGYDVDALSSTAAP